MSLVVTRILSFLTIVTIGDTFTDNEDIWPSGIYSLPKPISGCPETTPWSEGWIKQDLENTNHRSSLSPSFHMNATLTTEYINRTFCVKNIDYGTYQKPWPTGSYCIYQRYCSFGMVSGSIYWDDEDTNNRNERGGTLPAAAYLDYIENTLLYYCCQNQGQSFNAINLPTEKPFYLLPHGSKKCQRVKWALSSLEYIRYDTENVDNRDTFNGNHVFTNEVKSFPKIFYCYYVGCRYKLKNYHGFFSASSKTSPDNSYPDYQYCSWLITVNQTRVVSLSFFNISVPNCKENFIDVFDGVSSNETQLLARLCGQNATSGKTIISTGNNMYVVFKSGDNSKYPSPKLGFYAKYEAHQVQPATTTSTLTTTLHSGTSAETEATATTHTETETSTTIGEKISSTKRAFGGNTNFQNNSENKSTIVLAIVLPVLAVLLVSLAIIFFWRRHKQKNNDGMSTTEVETRENVFCDARINTVDTTKEATPSRYEMPSRVSRQQKSRTQLDVVVAIAAGSDSMNLIYESAGIVNNTNTDQVYCSADNVVYEAGNDIAEKNDDPSSSIYTQPDEIITDSTYSTPTISSPSEVHKIPGLSASQSEPVEDLYDNVE